MPTDDIVNLRVADLALLEALLRANQLPADDCREQAGNFYAVYSGTDLIAAGGLEPAGDYALLRSVVVAQQLRGRGLAQRLTDHLLHRAEADGRSAVYLLTDTAADYFSRLGFSPVERDRVPPSITRTRQFSSLCPDTASCLYLPLPRS